MQIKGVCRNCRYRRRYGAKGDPEHLYCIRDDRIVKSLRMKFCSKYEKADLNTLRHFKKRGFGSIGKI